MTRPAFAPVSAGKPASLKLWRGDGGNPYLDIATTYSVVNDHLKFIPFRGRFRGQYS